MFDIRVKERDLRMPIIYLPCQLCWTRPFTQWLHNEMDMHLNTARKAERRLRKESDVKHFIESWALSALLFPRLILARMKIEVNGKSAATILQKRSERTVARGVWSPFNQRGHNETMKNPGRFEGDSCSGGCEGDCDPTGGRERSDDCDGECMWGIDRRIKMSARTC